jgi:hypothetical protein
MNIIELAKRALGLASASPLLLTSRHKPPIFRVERGLSPQGADVLYVYGARWVKDDKPRVMVQAYRVLPMGDAIGFHMPRIADWPLSPAAKRLALYDGVAIEDVDGLAERLAREGLAVPDKPEPDMAFAISTYTRMAKTRE